MKLNKKIATIVLSSIAATSLSADITLGNANGALLGGMGVQNYQTNNVYNLWANPASITNYSNTAVLGLGTNSTTSTGYFAGSTYDLGAVGIIGIWSGRQNYSTNMSSIPTTDLFYGVDLGAMSVGTRVSLATDSQATGEGLTYNSYSNATNYTRTATRNDVTRSEIGVEVGVSLKDIPVAVAVGMHQPHYSSVVNAGTQTIIVDNITSIDANATTTIASDNTNYSANVQFMPTFGDTTVVTTGYYTLIGGNTATNTLDQDTNGTTSTTTKVQTDAATVGSTHTVGLDMALNIVPMKRTKVIFAVGVVATSYNGTLKNTLSNDTNGTITYTGGDTGTNDTATTTTTMSIPLTVAFEQNATTNFTYRVGGSMTMYNRNDATTVSTKNVLSADGKSSEALTSTSQTTNKVTNSVATINAGFTYTLTKNLALHAEVNKGFLLSGPDFISGAGGSNLNLNGALTYAY